VVDIKGGDIMAKGKGEEFVTVNFNLKKEYHDRLALLCSHRGDKGWYLNQAVGRWLSMEEEKVAAFNKRIKE